MLLHAGVEPVGDGMEESTLRGFQTQQVGRDARPIEIATGLAFRPFLFVTPIRKREGAPFPEQVGVGRTNNADICFPHPKISKYHAYFTKAVDGTLRVVDAGSKNGTYVNRELIPKKDPQPLEDRTILSFARFHVRYHTFEGFVRALSALR